MKKIIEENAYILSLQKGVEKINEGISLEEIKDYLKSKGFVIPQTYYQIWFFENFSSQELILILITKLAMKLVLITNLLLQDMLQFEDF